MEEELKDAFVLDYRYDLQTHQCRADWLYGMLQHVRNPAVYQHAVCTALNALGDPLSWHADQLCELAKRFAENGSPAAKAALENAVGRAGVGWRQLLHLDGAAALPRVFENWERFEDIFSWNVINAVSEEVGREQTMAGLKLQAQHSEAAARLLAEVHSWKDEAAGPYVPPTRQDMESRVEAGKHFGFVAFGRRASPEDIEHFWSRLQEEQRPEQLRCLLWMFRRRKSPQLADRLFERAASADQQIRYAARVALGHWTDRRVRAFALETLESQAAGLFESGLLELFVRNFQAGDAARLEARLPRSSDDDDALHEIAQELVEIAEANETPELAGCLLWVYEFAPCGVCRRTSVKGLERRSSLPEAIRTECLDDAEPETRALAAVWVPRSAD